MSRSLWVENRLVVTIAQQVESAGSTFWFLMTEAQRGELQRDPSKLSESVHPRRKRCRSLPGICYALRHRMEVGDA